MLSGGGRGGSRIRAAVALAAVLAMVMALPAGAAGWGEERSWGGGVYQHFLAWLGLLPSPGVTLGVTVKCDDGASIDPNGLCVKKGRQQGSRIGHQGTRALPLKDSDRGARIDPNRHT